MSDIILTKQGTPQHPSTGDVSLYINNDGIIETVDENNTTRTYDFSAGAVTDVSVTPTEGVTASVDGTAQHPNINIGLGNITPTSVSASGTVTGSNLSGTNTGDQDLTPYILKTQAVFKDAKVLIVKKTPGTNEYGSISSAIADISGSSDVNPFVIAVGPGVFVEPQLVLPAFTSIVGTSINSTILSPSDPSSNFILMSNMTELSFLSLKGVSGSIGSGKSAIYCEDVGDFAQIHKLSIYDFDTAIRNKSVATNSTIYSEYTDINGNYTVGIDSEATNDFACKTQLENFYAYGSTTSGSTSILARGHLCDVKLGTAGIEGCDYGVSFYNQASVIISDTFVKVMTNGIYNPNTGGAASIRTQAVSFVDCTNNFKILHTGTAGSLSGSSELSKNTISSSSISVLLLDPSTSQLTINGKIQYSPDGYADTSDISSLILNTPTMGLIEGGDISIGSGLSVNVSSGHGYVMVGTDPNDYAKKTVFTSQSISIPANAISYIYVNNSGILSYGSSIPDTETIILLGRAISDSSNVLYLEDTALDAHHYNNKVDRVLREAFGAIFNFGALVSEHGTRQLLVTAGEYYYSQKEISLAGGTGVTFDAFYRSASPGIYTKVPSLTTVQNSYYDDGSGTLASIPTSKYVKHLLVAVGSPNEKYLVVYGQTTHNTQNSAEAAGLPLLPSFIGESFVRIASIVVQEGASNIISFVDERPRIGFASSSVTGAITSHSALTDLNHDDHLQYIKVDGTRAFTGSQSLGGNALTNVSTVNGVTVESHESRHLPNGSDPLTTSAPTSNLSSSSTNDVGIANSFARGDHSHAINSSSTNTASSLVSRDSGGNSAFNTVTANSLVLKLSTKTSSYTITNSDYIILANGTLTLTLPSPSSVLSGINYVIKNIGTGTVTISPSASETIDGETSILVNSRYTSLNLITDGTNWFVF